MDVLTLLESARRAGLAVSVEGDRLVVRGPQRAEDLARRILERKPDVIAALRIEAAVHEATGATDALELGAWIERFEERAAVMEYDAGLLRAEAERQARLFPASELRDPEASSSVGGQ